MSNREILFKGFVPDEDGKQIITLNGKDYRGDWVEGFVLKLTETRWAITDYYPVNPHSGAFANKRFNTGDMIIKLYEIIPQTLCQFTGLTDKNGKRIWEWDNIRVFGGESDDEFCEYDNTFVLEMPNPDHLGQIRDAENVEVIGDIFNTRSVE